jgi:hypothetical protein
MRVLVLGAYGVFGARLCKLLAENPQVALTVSGRDIVKAKALCTQLSGSRTSEAIVIDRDTVDGQFLTPLRLDIVIDASGPFQSYGDRPYRVVQACLDAGVNYLDFADGASFVEGIAAFDAQARGQGVFMLSGVSSFPVLTAAVVRRLSADMLSVDSVRGGIAPSPFAIVGRNVIRAIAGYAGQPVDMLRGGKACQGHALTESVGYTIAPPGHLPLRHTRFSLVEVPDLRELPKLWPTLQDVWMGAGPVPETLHRMLNALAWLVKWRVLGTLLPFSSVFFHAINLLRWGEHRGGMFIEVKGKLVGQVPVHRSWHLLAEGEDGPYIPCMALQAIVHNALSGTPPTVGARAASRDLELADYEPLFAARTIHTGIRQHDPGDMALFEVLLGSAFDCLPDSVRAVHRSGKPLALSGRAQVQRGTGLVARCVARLAGFPPASADTHVSVNIDRGSFEPQERWHRRFGAQRFASTLSIEDAASQYLLVERYGPLRFYIALVVADNKLSWIVRGASLWGITLPKFLVPGGDSFEYESEGRFHFHVEVTHPLAGLIVRYRGWLVPDVAPS